MKHKRSGWRPGMPITIEALDEAMAKLALLIRAQGDHGLAVLPIFERLEREREALVNLDARLDRAIARGNSLNKGKTSDV